MSLLPDAPANSSNEEHLYNIGVVTRLTGISMATLRAWERRYDFPEAGRTAGGHRLYSEKDIMRLRWVKSRIDEGMQTAQAIHALHHQEASDHPIQIAPPAKSQIESFDRPALQIYRNQLMEALLQKNLNEADQILGEALAISSPEDLILNMIGPAISTIGDAWEKNQISIAVEHLATNFLRQRLLLWMASGPPPISVKPVVLACAPNEWHEGSLLMMGALLRRRRWPIAYLGQAVPLPDLTTFIREIKPSAVVIVAMTENSVAELAEWPQYMPDIAQSGKPIICYGGRVFIKNPEWQVRVPGVYLGSSIEQGIEKLERSLSHDIRTAP